MIPIVLHHGLLGFPDLKAGPIKFKSFRKIDEALAALKHPVIVTRVHPTAGIQAGREIDKRRPAIVLSPLAYNRRSGICLAVPTDLSPGPFWISMPPGFLSSPSLILCDYVKSFDYRERSARLIGRVPEALIEEIVGKVTDLIDPVR